MKSKLSFFIVFLAALIGLGSVSDQLNFSLFSFTPHRFIHFQEYFRELQDLFRGPEFIFSSPSRGPLPLGVVAHHAEYAEIQKNDGQQPHHLGPTLFQLNPSRFAEEVLASSHDRLGVRQEMLELLDQLVRSEWEYHQKTGRFTPLISELPHFFFSAVDSGFELRVLDAQPEHFLAGAFSWENHQRSEQALVNERYEIRAHFTLPEPSFDHLKSVALQHLKNLWSSSVNPADDEPTLFKHYFKYQDTLDAQGQRTVTALGLKGAVAGLILEWRGESSLSRMDGTMFVSAPLGSDLIIEKVQQKIQPGAEKRQPLQTFNALKMSSRAQSQVQGQLSERRISSTHHSNGGHLSAPSIYFQRIQSPLVIEPIVAPTHLKR